MTLLYKIPFLGSLLERYFGERNGSQSPQETEKDRFTPASIDYMRKLNNCLADTNAALFTGMVTVEDLVTDNKPYHFFGLALPHFETAAELPEERVNAIAARAEFIGVPPEYVESIFRTYLGLSIPNHSEREELLKMAGRRTLRDSALHNTEGTLEFLANQGFTPENKDDLLYVSQRILPAANTARMSGIKTTDLGIEVYVAGAAEETQRILLRAVRMMLALERGLAGKSISREAYTAKMISTLDGTDGTLGTGEFRTLYEGANEHTPADEEIKIVSLRVHEKYTPGPGTVTQMAAFDADCVENPDVESSQVLARIQVQEPTQVGIQEPSPRELVERSTTGQPIGAYRMGPRKNAPQLLGLQTVRRLEALNLALTQHLESPATVATQGVQLAVETVTADVGTTTDRMPARSYPPIGETQQVPAFQVPLGWKKSSKKKE